MPVKSYLSIFLFTSILVSCSNQSGNKLSNLVQVDTLSGSLRVSPHSHITFTDTTLNDTIFLFRTLSPDYYHAVYVDTNRNSKAYQKLTNFAFDSYYQEAFENNAHFIKEKYPDGYKIHNRTNLPQKWLPIEKYKDRYYLYEPSDGGNIGRLIINDTSFVDWGMEGPFPLPFRSIQRMNKRQYLISLEDPFSETLENIRVTILDSKTKLSLFETIDSNGKVRYELYIPIEYANRFDVVVNYTTIGKQPEFEFDAIDSMEIQRVSILE